MNGMPREQFITQVIFHLLSTTAPQWYGREFQDPAEVNTKIIGVAEDLYEKYKVSIGDAPNVIAAPIGMQAPIPNPFKH